ncbi:MAG: hypothetical protein LBM70_09210 [Victivallales bacterium]|jgi:hypothetical protein|nr:hypothetical protein [Victivallales bacterium]
MFGSTYYREFAILAFDSESVRGCVFRRHKERYAIERNSIEKIDPADPALAWKRLLKQLGRGKECPLYLVGALPGGVFFRFDSIELTPRSQREALELELPQRIPLIPEDHRLQFYAGVADTDGNVPVNVYVAPGVALEHLAAMLTQSDGRADEFIYPLLAYQKGDSPIDLPRLDSDFGFADGEWRPKLSTPDFEPYVKIFSQEFKFPADGSFNVEDYFECLFTARLVMRPDFRQAGRALRLLPVELHPRRYRNSLHVTVLLVLLLIVNYAWFAVGDYRQNYIKHKSMITERDRLKYENSTLTTTLKKNDKEQRELTRLVNLKVGESDVIGKLAVLTGILPPNAMVSSLRWSESSLDLVIQCEDESLDLPSLLRRVPYWKIDQLQQRRMGDVVTMSTLKLIPNPEAAK